MKNNRNHISSRFIGKRGEEYQIGRAERSFSRIYQAEMYFKPYVSDKDTILDFGCNDGLFLRHLSAKKRIGIDVSEAARQECAMESRKTGIDIELHENILAVESNSIDVVISNHCLEHTLAPFDVLTEVKRVLKPGCLLVMVIPFDDWRSPLHQTWKPDDFDNHLYTWSPRNIGNLLTEVGFKVEETRFCRIAISGRLRWVRQVFGDRVFRVVSRLLARYKNKGEVFVRALKPLKNI